MLAAVWFRLHTRLVDGGNFRLYARGAEVEWLLPQADFECGSARGVVC